MQFTDAHASSGVCSPSRYTLLTGRYPWRTQNSCPVGLWGTPRIPTDRLTIAKLAKKHGYRTACCGKWHLGWIWPIPEKKKQLFASTPALRSLAEPAPWIDASQTATGWPTTATAARRATGPGPRVHDRVSRRRRFTTRTRLAAGSGIPGRASPRGGYPAAAGGSVRLTAGNRSSSQRPLRGSPESAARQASAHASVSIRAKSFMEILLRQATFPAANTF